MERQEYNDKRGARRCPECGTAFICGIAAGAERCWCFDLPAAMPVRADTACLCPACLMKVLREARQ